MLLRLKAKELALESGQDYCWLSSDLRAAKNVSTPTLSSVPASYTKGLASDLLERDDAFAESPLMSRLENAKSCNDPEGFRTG